ncbi:MAG: hypothetical protein ISQ27_06880 [PS1 clade bacterium]|nr:hypothetical protein [PS1 clade bacterium]|tara:strand:- start:1060 stop:2016 length:957 start_codon:yes stop_codon:yes gene_type:complete
MSLPLAIIGGYLGAGKTTLVNRLLREPHGHRLTILVNDLGKVNIDAGLIAAHDGTTLTLTNGCACCQMQEDLTSQLMMLVAQDDLPDAIVIEASGAGEPARLALAGAGIGGLTLTGVFVVADATTLAAKRHDKFVGRLVTRQIAQADLVMLSKTDISPDTGAGTRQLIETMTDAPIIDTCSITDVTALLLAASKNTAATGQPHDISPHDFEPDTTRADALFEHIYFTADTPLAPTALSRVLDKYAGQLTRAKGHTGTHRLQLVDTQWKLTPATRDAVALVFISVRGACNLTALENDLKKDLEEVVVGPAGLEPATKPL